MATRITIWHQRGNERYIFRFRPEQADEVRERIAKFASCRAIAFDWSDASMIGDALEQALLTAGKLSWWRRAVRSIAKVLYPTPTGA